MFTLRIRFALALGLIASLTASASAQTWTVDFADLSLPGPNSAYYGQDHAGGFTSRGAFFNNQFTDFGSGVYDWIGFAYSNVANVTTPGYGNQYAAYHLPNGGGDNTANYAICYSFNCIAPNIIVDSFARLTLPGGTRPDSISITNTTYAALSMLYGDGFAKRFGGPTGNDPDFFLLQIQGRDNNNNITGTVPFYLADYRFADNNLDYIVSHWTSVDLSSLPDSTTALSFVLTSSDIGQFGMNTPAYFALDNFVVSSVPEPGFLLAGAATLLGGAAWWRRRRTLRSLSRDLE
jgi:hypothetical protein